MILTSICLILCQISRATYILAESRAATGLKDEQLEAILKLLARAVVDYAADVLRGDISVFATLDKLAKKREQESMQHYT